MESIGVAVIGAGMAGRAHAHGYRSAGTVFSEALYAFQQFKQIRRPPAPADRADGLDAVVQYYPGRVSCCRNHRQVSRHTRPKNMLGSMTKRRVMRCPPELDHYVLSHPLNCLSQF